MVMKTKRNLIIFIAVALASGWLGVLLDMVLSEQPEGNSLGMLLWLVTPILTAVVLRIIDRDGKGIGLKPNLKGNGKWYGVSLLIYPVVTIITVCLAMVFGSVELSGFTAALLPMMAAAFLIEAVKNIFEEFAWRGYLTPKLMEYTKNDWCINAVSGLVWALWHVPYYLIFLPDRYFTSMSRGTMVLMGILIMSCWNIMFVEIYRLTKSVWPVVLMHAVEDAVPTLLVTEGYFIFTKSGDTFFSPTDGVIATALFLCIGFFLRLIRIKKERAEAK